jgi:hypothetical protein
LKPVGRTRAKFMAASKAMDPETYEVTVERHAGIIWQAPDGQEPADGDTLGYTWPSARGESGKTGEFGRNVDAEGWPSGRWRWS